jgi:hypothetical protein
VGPPIGKLRDAAPVESVHSEPKPTARRIDLPEAAPAHVDAKPAHTAESETRPKVEPNAADGSAAPKPVRSKWGRLLGDKTEVGTDDYLLSRCKAAAENGNCAAAKAIAARIAEKNVAMYRARVLTDAAIAACLNAK